MATNTGILDLVKPAGNENALISVINSNMDKVDAEAGRARGNIAANYSTSSAYDVGDLCIYQGNLYRCNTAIASGEEWTAAHWTQVNIAGELDSQKQAIAGKINTSDIANNLTTTTAGKVLDARQGKALNDAINTIFPQVQTATSSKSVTFTITHQAGLIILRRPNTASSANVGLVAFVKQNSTVNVQSISNAWSDTTVTGGTNNVTVSTTYSNGIIVHLMQFGEW